MKKHVIVIDDNHFTVEGIVSQVDWENLDAEIIGTFNDGFSAIDFSKDHPVDLVISDIEMPGINGIEMCTKLLEQHPDLKIILISAFDKFDYAKKAIRIGVADYIEKPISYPYLSEKLETVFKDMDLEDQTRSIVEKSKPIIQEKLISDLISYSGTGAEEHLARYAKYLNLSFNYACYNVIKIQIENADFVEKEYGVQLSLIHI